MEALSAILKHNVAANGSFKLIPSQKYQQLDITHTHLAFADDLFVMCSADVESFLVVKRSL